MTKKKRGHPDVEEVLSRPWCYYCERDFDDLKILINHQKAKHFKCERCGRRLNTAGGLSVHMSQVHKENLTAVDNALPNRAGLDIEIFGMEGIPEDIVQQHYQRVLTNYHQTEAERRAATGNLAPGAPGGGAPKKPKFESPADIKKRLAEHKARKEAEAANGTGSGGGTPVGAGQAAPSQPQPQDSFHAGSPQYPQYQQPYSAPPPPSSVPYNQPTPYAPSPVPASPFQQHPPAGYPPQPAFSPPPFQPSFQSQPGYQGQPQYQNPPPYTPQPPYQNQPPYQSQPTYQHQPPYQPQPFPNQAYSPPVHNVPPQFQGPSGGPPRPYGAPSPHQPFPQQPYQQQRTHTPPQNGAFPQRTGSGSLPPAPGLPQRPAFGAPQVNAHQLQQMHHGQVPASQNPPPPQQQYPSQNGQANQYQPPPQSQPQYQLPPQAAAAPSGVAQESANASSLDDLISNASKQADAAVKTEPQQIVQAPAETTDNKEEAGEDKTAKKDKDKEKPKSTKLIYSDNDISPEEKMAMMPRYAYTPDKKSIMV